MVAGVFAPVINSTVITTRTMRTPPFLRASVHAAAVTLALMLAPLGALAAGPLLHLFGLDVAIAAILTLNTLCGIAFVAAGVRERRRGGTSPYLARTRSEDALPAASATTTSTSVPADTEPSRTR